ncbi:MAG: hypothetical protein ACD_46C00300G0003 [uncultured bacterium]|nr:MAG: hypothetical protein ACD_46C00300G0003 [uncultured bacterium]
MLFNSVVFIFFFLPITLLLFFLIAKQSQKAGLAILFLASVIFYGWNDYHYVFLLLFSILINFIISKQIISSASNLKKKYLLCLGLIFNLSLLAYFKYTNFFIETINLMHGEHLSNVNILLPIGISFFTFTQIAFLVDSYRGLVHQYHLLNYALFVTYYPHLIAGPIIHHKEVMPQFDKKRTFLFNHRNFSIGLVIFVIGLFKKIILADHLAISVSPVYDSYQSDISALDAWIASLSYTLELYFDFSGYSDMAVGLSYLIGIKLPVNFYSPYKANNIIEFWRRWNMTLSRFLRDYLYIPLGGNRKGFIRRYINLIITMLLGGLWHGANWTFVAWGCLHGIYLCFNHGWVAFKKMLGIKTSNSIFLRMMACFFTCLSVMIAWVFFRSSNFSTAYQILHAMFFKQLILPGYWHVPNMIKIVLLKLHIRFTTPTDWTILDPVANFYSIVWIFISLVIVWIMPNTYQMMHKYNAALNPFKEKIHSWLCWRPSLAWNFLTITAFVLDILFIQTSSVFLYFSF